MTSSLLALGLMSAPAAASEKIGETGQSSERSKPVTLITGDRVLGTSVQPGPGRDKITFSSWTEGDHRYVLPSDARNLLREGKLDKRLFDVTALAAVTKDNQLPLLVSYPNAGASRVRSALTAGEARVTRDLSALGTLAVRADLEGRKSIWSSLTAGSANARTLDAGVQKIWLDGLRQVNLDRSVAQIGAPAAYQAGFDGTGVTVGVLDTGIDATHPDLAGQIAASENFTTEPSTDDIVGHGTHVASTIAGTGAASGGKYKGVAPGAKLAIGKVCETFGCEESAILAGMIWAADRAPVVNLSLGGTDTPEVDPLEQAVEDLTASKNTLFVIAAGNAGERGTIGSPSSADSALSVGAVDREDQVADFSSKGPRTGDGALKPDITAPGVDIVAAKAANGDIGDPAADGYVALSGTSMATPHVAGAAALLVQQHPDWSAKLRKNTLIASAKPTPDTNAFDQGAGRVDVSRQITQTVTVDEGSASFGIQAWPHDDDQPITRTVTYRNAGSAPVTLTLTTSGAPFTVAASTLTVPAGGTAATTVTATTDENLPEGELGGYLTAVAASGVRVSTALGVVNEVESYNLTVNVIGRDGQPSEDSLTVLLGLDEFAAIDVFGSSTIRVPKARYGLFSWVYQGEENTAMLTETELSVTEDRTLTIDARTAKPIKVTAPQRDAGTLLAAVNADWILDDLGYGASLVGFDFTTIFAAPLSKVSKPFFIGSVNGSFARLDAEESAYNSPYTTDLAYFNPGRMFNGLTKAPKLRELAVIKASYGVEATGVHGVKGNSPRFSEESGYWTSLVPFDLPFRRTEYVNPDVKWSSEFHQELPPNEEGWSDWLDEAISAPAKFKAGRTYHQQWNRGVFGPNVTQPPFDPYWVTRQGDLIIANVPLHGDGAGHPGFAYQASYETKLYRNGTLVGEGIDTEVPPGRAAYRLEASATRGAPHTLSTDVRGVWTFKSGHVAGEDFQRLPLHTVRFAPPLSAANAAPSGRSFGIPVIVEHQPDVKVGKIKSLKVEVSFNDGKTWQKAPLKGSVATVKHPKGKGFVSLRAFAADSHGNTVSQTVIRAYALS
ncbi:serine protease [Actinoplanes sp. OR16]|uniref:S8 family serine peptidase n=1 Tax=Actinoplanes sp. OR16 TaxID=946334 RepID=UPI000F6D49E7|nr:S8 family serine peptidase [Actinoplanes sp. OR16]BBH67723.1 serine protease [Actinoplanes sp. OR16]